MEQTATTDQRVMAARAPAEGGVRITLGDLSAAAPVLERLLAASLPARVAYHLAQIKRAATPELTYVQAQRTARIQEFGIERDPTEAERTAGMTRVWEVAALSVPAFTARIAELLAVETTLAVAPQPLAELDAVTVTGHELLALGPLVAGDAAP